MITFLAYCGVSVYFSIALDFMGTNNYSNMRNKFDDFLFTFISEGILGFIFSCLEIKTLQNLLYSSTTVCTI